MEITCKLVINKVWLKEQTDIRKCSACQDEIYSEMYRLWLMPHVDKLRLIGEKTNICLCESCFGLLD